MRKLYWKGVVRCEEAKVYLAICVMLEFALEVVSYELLFRVKHCLPKAFLQHNDLRKIDLPGISIIIAAAFRLNFQWKSQVVKKLSLIGPTIWRESRQWNILWLTHAGFWRIREGDCVLKCPDSSSGK